VSGGADRGFNLHVQTILCRDCQAIYDAVVRLRIPDPQGFKRRFGLRPGRGRAPSAEGPPVFESALNRLPVAGLQFQWIQFSIRCPVSPVHRVRTWNEPDTCPRCGVYLEKTALPYRIWE
jgi:hypothetical protein